MLHLFNRECPEQQKMRDAARWCFRALLRREPDDASVDWLAHLGRPVDTMADLILASPEFKATHHRFSAHLTDRWVMYECPLGFKIWLNLSDAAVCWPILDDEFERDEVAFVNKHLRDGMHALDIGANVGFYSMMMARAVGERGRVTAFEPRPVWRDYAARSAADNGFGHCTVLPFALGASCGKATLAAHRRSSNKGAAQLRAAAPDDESFTVEIRRLCDLDVAKIDFIKIDVEGAEHLALAPAIDRIAADKPLIMSELAPQHLAEISRISAEQYIAMFIAAGYDCIDIATGERFADFGARLFANVAFIPR